MGRCPACGYELATTTTTAARLRVCPSRVRAILKRPWRLAGVHLGRDWLLPGAAVAAFQPQPSGVHLPPDADQGAAAPAGPTLHCPQCGEELLSVAQAAALLGITASAVYGLLRRCPERLGATRLGCRWLMSRRHIEAEQKRRGLLQKLTAGTADLPPPGVEPDLRAAEREVVGAVELYVKPQVCWCHTGKYRFPHRWRSGSCTAERPVPKPIRQRPVEATEPAPPPLTPPAPPAPAPPAPASPTAEPPPSDPPTGT